MKIEIKRDILIPAWNLIKDDSKIKKIQFIPGVLSIVFLSALLTYQIIYTYSVLADKKEETLEKILNFIHSKYITEFIIGAIIFIIAYIILIPIFEGALIKYIDKKVNKKEDIEVGEVISIGFYKFLPIFEYNNLFSEFKFLSVINFYLFMLRFFEFHYIKQINYAFLIIFLFSLLINLLLSYSKYFIVIENKGIFQSIGASTKLSLINLKVTLKLYFIMFILNIRVLFNIIVFLIFPILIVTILGFITSQIIKTITIVSIIFLFILFILFLGYLAGVLDTFKGAIWYYAYKTGKQKLEEIEKEI